MTEDEGNLVLRLLREIPGKLDDHDKAFGGLDRHPAGIDRRMEQMKQLEARPDKLERSQ